MADLFLPSAFAAPSVLPSEQRKAAASAPLPDIVSGTGSPDIYGYHDDEEDAEVWGVRARPAPEESPDSPPIYVIPELRLPDRQPGRPAEPQPR